MNIDLSRAKDPSSFDTARWLRGDATAPGDFARFMRHCLAAMDRSELNTHTASNLSRRFTDEGDARNIRLWQHGRRDRVLWQLLFDCWNELGDLNDPYCNTSRSSLNLLIDVLAEPEKLEAHLKTANDWDLAILGGLRRDPAIRAELDLRLPGVTEEFHLERALEAVAHQAPATIPSYLPGMLRGRKAAVQRAALEVLQETSADCHEAYDLLVQLGKDGAVLKDAQVAFACAMQVKLHGPHGLILLARDTKDPREKIYVVRQAARHLDEHLAHWMADLVANDPHEPTYSPAAAAAQALDEQPQERLRQWFPEETLSALGLLK